MIGRLCRKFLLLALKLGPESSWPFLVSALKDKKHNGTRKYCQLLRIIYTINTVPEKIYCIQLCSSIILKHCAKILVKNNK